MVRQWLEGANVLERRRYQFWINNQFTPPEARWATERGIAIGGDTAKWLVRQRDDEIEFYLTRLSYVKNRAHAIRLAAQSLRGKNILDGFVGPDAYNIFRIASP